MVHFHHLIFKAAARLLGPQGRVWLRHGAASAFVWVIVASCQLGALLTWERHGAALALALGFVVLYLSLYSSIGRKDWAMPAPMQPEFSAGSTGA
jgi:hypothetical protein